MCRSQRVNCNLNNKIIKSTFSSTFVKTFATFPRVLSKSYDPFFPFTPVGVSSSCLAIINSQVINPCEFASPSNPRQHAVANTRGHPFLAGDTLPNTGGVRDLPRRQVSQRTRNSFVFLTSKSRGPRDGRGRVLRLSRAPGHRAAPIDKARQRSKRDGGKGRESVYRRSAKEGIKAFGGGGGGRGWSKANTSKNQPTRDEQTSVAWLWVLQ